MKMWPLKSSTELQLLEPLGEGLTSQVYRAIRKSHRWGVHQEVAVKVLHSKKADQTLKNEIAALLQINSQHCVRLLGWADLKQGPAIILEYLNGVSLLELCAYGPESSLIAEEVLAQLQQGLKDLHEHGIRHGDLSAKNIFITHKGVLKILDFGFSQKESTKAVAGTPQFLSIEGWRGERQTTQSDLFSLGLIYQDLLAGSLVAHGSQDGWRRRAQSVLDQTSLLREDPQQREYLPVTSTTAGRKYLSECVLRVQSAKLAMNNTTHLKPGTPLKKSEKNNRPYRVLVLFLGFNLFFYQLQPADLKENQQNIHHELHSLDVRSQKWAQVGLFQKSGNHLLQVRPTVYAPYSFKNLPRGDYELHWVSGGQKGIIFVQIKQSERILMR